MQKLDRLTVINIAIVGLIILLIFGVWLSQRGDSDQDRLSRTDVEEAGSSDAAAKACGSQRTYDLIKRDLFRRAARIRGSGGSAFDRLSAAAVVRVEDPVMTERDAELGAISCSGRLSLDLPPGLAVVGGRRTLQADIEYRLQPAADGSGNVPILEGADAILIPLATLARVDAPLSPRIDPQVTDQSGIPESVPSVPPLPPSPGGGSPTATRGMAGPSFNCRLARTRGEIAVCNDPGLAALDRQMAGQFQTAMAATDARRQQWLRATRDSFLRYRDRCGTSACIADAYRGRMREIDDIVSGRWRPGS